MFRKGGEQSEEQSSRLLISAAVYRAVEGQLLQVEPLSVKPVPNAKPIRVYRVHPNPVSLPTGEEQAPEATKPEPLGWLEALREWLQAWSRF
jgi:hypothetical protein